MISLTKIQKSTPIQYSRMYIEQFNRIYTYMHLYIHMYESLLSVISLRGITLLLRIYTEKNQHVELFIILRGRLALTERYDLSALPLRVITCKTWNVLMREIIFYYNFLFYIASFCSLCVRALLPPVGWLYCIPTAHFGFR